MTGFVKPKKYLWQESNLALFGSDIEKKIKKCSSEFEPCWKGITEICESKLIVWRIEQFKVVSWPTKDYGTFYDGDSYVALKVTKSDLKLLYDIHFWIGKYSSQDEYGTAAYKTVELDNLLNDAAIQHREVQGYESERFKSYFKIYSIIKGGTNSGFRHVDGTRSTVKLLEVSESNSKFTAKEIKMRLADLNPTKAYALDAGDELIMWIGRNAGKTTWIKMMPFMKHLEVEKSGKVRSRMLHEESADADDSFYQYFTDYSVSKKPLQDVVTSKRTLFKLSDASGQLKFSKLREGNLTRELISEMDVYLIDSGRDIFVFIGASSSKNEKKNALIYAHQYLKTSTNALASVTCLNSNNESPEFESLFDTTQ